MSETIKIETFEVRENKIFFSIGDIEYSITLDVENCSKIVSDFLEKMKMVYEVLE